MISEFKRFGDALDELLEKKVDRLLFPHYLDLIYIMSNDVFYRKRILSELYVARVFDTPFQIGMVMSSGKETDQHFYTCLEIMVSRFSRKVSNIISIPSPSLSSSLHQTTLILILIFILAPVHRPTMLLR